MLHMSDEEKMILDMVDDLCSEVLHERAAAIDAEDAFPEDVFDLFVEQGLFSLGFDEEYGGVGVSMHCYMSCVERIARESPACAMMLLISTIGADCLLVAGSEEQKRALLPALASGEAKISFALTEPKAGSDASAISSTARLVDGGYVLNGSKTFITNAAVADYFAVFAKLVDEGEQKPCCFIVPKGTPGLSVGKPEEKMGLHGSLTSQVFFENVLVELDALVGEVGDGFKIAHHTLNRGRLSVAALATGITDACVRAASQYASERKQFGQPIAQFQAIQQKIADMELSLVVSRLLMENAATAYEQESSEMMASASAAKLYCSEAAVSAAEQAVQVFGGCGLCREYPVERYYRDSKFFTILEGTSEVQRMLIAKSAMKKYVQTV